jgi:hypothetical protein
VLDFTGMSDSQLASFFKKPSEGSVCGRFFQDQLDRSIEIPKKSIPWVKYFFQFALPAFLISMKATAQGKVKTAMSINKPSVTNCTEIMGNLMPVKKKKLIDDTILAPVSNSVFIKGKVIGENNEPVPFATVMIKGTKIGVAADSVGVFKIEKIQVGKEIILQVSSVGYEAKEMLINSEELTNDLHVQLSRLLTGEVVVVASYVNYKMGGVTGSVSIVKSETRKILPEEKSFLQATKVYPNPVQRNNVFNLEFENKLDETMQLAIIGVNGATVSVQSKKITKGLNHLSITADAKWAAGIYNIQLRNEKGTLIKQEKLIVQ